MMREDQEEAEVIAEEIEAKGDGVEEEEEPMVAWIER
jgi:hypothetical protein